MVLPIDLPAVDAVMKTITKRIIASPIC